MQFSSPIPRPEYPRPDRQRGLVEGIDWLNLNGPWQFRFDPERRGREERWFAERGPDWREQILVPFCWESLAAWGQGDAAGNDNYFSTRVHLDPLAVTRENHRSAPRHEVGWYRRRVTVPAAGAWSGRRPVLTIGASDFFTEVWCNGQPLGAREGGYLPHEFDLGPALPADGPREALLVIRVEDPMDNAEQPVGKQWGWYTPTSGIWQTVFLEPRAACCLDHFRIIPDLDAGEVRFEFACEGASAAGAVQVEIMPPEGAAQAADFPVRDGAAAGAVRLTALFYWEPSNPRLYRVVFRLVEDGREHDTVRSYFGMRKIHTAPAPGDEKAPALLCLNNQPIYLRGALYQSYHPEGVYTARDARTLCNDIAFAREAGFDFLRIHIKLDDPLLLYYADTLGILLMQDFPNFGEGGDTPLGRRRFEEMMRLGIRRDFNHPSIIAWCLFNETWGFGGQTELMKVIAPELGQRWSPKAAEKVANSSSFRWVHAMWQVAKTLDPTRLVEDMSVVAWEHLAAYGHVDTDINSWHFYLQDYAKARAHIEEVVARTYRGSTFNYVEGYEQRGVPLINSEYGGLGALDEDQDASWTFKFLTNELRRHGQLSAYIFTQLTDVEWEFNGLLNYDRTPKHFGYPPSLVNRGDVLPINAPPIAELAPGATVEVEVLSSHFSRRVREGVTLHWHYSGMDTLGTRHDELARGAVAIPFPHYRVAPARRVRLTAPAEPMLCTLWVSAVCRDGETLASNYVQHFVPPAPFCGREERGRSLVLRRRTHEWSAAAWNGPCTTAAEAQAARSCGGHGTGFFEWEFSDDAIARLGEAQRVRLLCEVSSCREDTAQTDAFVCPTEFELRLNDFAVHRAHLPNHPHDSRGALSYLRGGRGAHGYLMTAVVEKALLARVAESAPARASVLRFRCAVPEGAGAHGGLTVYDYDAGRYPICPTIIIEWSQEEGAPAR